MDSNPASPELKKRLSAALKRRLELSRQLTEKSRPQQPRPSQEVELPAQNTQDDSTQSLLKAFSATLKHSGRKAAQLHLASERELLRADRVRGRISKKDYADLLADLNQIEKELKLA